MPKKPKKSLNSKPPPGLKPEMLGIEGNWQDAVKTPLVEKKPVGGWPK
jgi:hypothetical protein